MKTAAGISSLGPEFDAFLFAPVGENRTGMQISVVSVLARLDLDPWQEAARLAALPRESAAHEIASMLTASPDPALKPIDIPVIAGGLVALLPSPIAYQTTPLRMLFDSGAKIVPTQRANVLFLVFYLIFMLATQFFMLHLGPAQADSAQPPSSGSAPSQIAPAPQATK
jgi:hypothetical protein